jgi:cytochrome P450
MLTTTISLAPTTLTYACVILLGLTCALILKIVVWELSYYFAMKKFAVSNKNAVMGPYFPFFGFMQYLLPSTDLDATTP